MFITQALSKARAQHSTSNASPSVLPEYRLWEQQWVRCCKELNQWTSLQEFATSKGNHNPHLIIECAWRLPNWTLMKEALSQVVLQVDNKVRHWHCSSVTYTAVLL